MDEEHVGGAERHLEIEQLAAYSCGVLLPAGSPRRRGKVRETLDGDVGTPGRTAAR